MIEKGDWVVVYKRAIQDDGTLLFPERLSKEFLDKAKKAMGSYLFANQYQNEIIPEEKQTFKKHWVRYYKSLPEGVINFAFVDPAISEADTADYTGIVVVATDVDQNWYLRYAQRHRVNPTDLIELCFTIHDKYQTKAIGIEDVAFQRSITHFAREEMKRRNKMIPLTGVKPSTQTSKEMRILGLVPRFEWGTLFLSQGMTDLEMELAKFPRGRHDDILDALASIENIIYYPQKKKEREYEPSPNDPAYESWYIKKLTSGRNQSQQRED